MSVINKFIGDRRFYRTVLTVSVPIMIQNGITNFVNLLDNIMVGRLGTEQMSGVSIVNQFVFVFNLLIFGAISAAGIFTAQYHGYGDEEGERNTFRFKFVINIAAGILGVAAFYFFDDQLISLFLHDGSDMGDIVKTLGFGKQYLKIMLIGLIPYAIAQVYASTMRETGQTIVPMTASIIAVFTNFVLNYILIFGKLGIAPLGVSGAAIATVVSRFAELAVLLIWGYTHKKRCPYLVGAFRKFHIPAALCTSITAKGLPLMLNEFLWSVAVTFRNQCYSTRGLDVVAAQNISSTIFNVFSVVYMALGSAIAIVVGNLLGAAKLDEAKDTARKMITFSVFCALGIGAILIVCSGVFPSLYNTTEHVRYIASYMMIVSAFTMPMCAFANAAYFTMRSGGKVLITLLFDSVYMWSVVIPIAYVTARFTNVNIYILFAICQSTEVLKAAFGFFLIKRGTWVKQLVANDSLKKA